MINSDHEEIAKYIVKAITEDQTHAVSQQTLRQYFTNPYRLHEYDLALKILKDFDVIRHNNNDRLIPGNVFYNYKTLKALYKSKTDWKFWSATIIAIFSAGTAFYFSYTDRQKSNTIDKLEKLNKEIRVTKDSLLVKNDSLQSRVNYIDSISKHRVEKTDTVSNKK